MDIQDLSDTKSLPTFSIQLDPKFSLKLNQQNNTNSHGTTVWDSAKLLGFYLFDHIKKPTFKNNRVQNHKTCLELGSGCGLGGLVMASLGFDTTMTDLPDVIESVTRGNCLMNINTIQEWWHLLHHTSFDDIKPPKITVQPLDWLCLDFNQKSPTTFDYILASDCIYEIKLVEPLLQCIKYYSSQKTTVFIAVERRDDTVVNNFIEKTQLFGFSAKMVLKKLLKNDYVNNEDVEIWKLKIKRQP